MFRQAATRFNLIRQKPRVWRKIIKNLITLLCSSLHLHHCRGERRRGDVSVVLSPKSIYYQPPCNSIHTSKLQLRAKNNYKTECIHYQPRVTPYTPRGPRLFHCRCVQCTSHSTNQGYGERGQIRGGTRRGATSLRRDGDKTWGKDASYGNTRPTNEGKQTHRQMRSVVPPFHLTSVSLNRVSTGPNQFSDKQDIHIAGVGVGATRLH